MMKKLLLSTLLSLPTAAAFASAGASDGGGLLGSDMIFKTINFFTLLILLHFLAKKPLTKMMRDTALAKKDEFDEKKKAVLAAEQRLEDFKQMMAAEELQLAERRKAALKAIEGEKDRIIADAQAQALNIEKAAEQRLEQGLNKVKAQIREFLAEEASKLAEDGVKKAMSAKEQKVLMKTYAERLDG